METLEFIMQTNLTEALPATLEFNFEDLKSALAERMELYRGLVVTEDGIKAAKQDRADLNKLREAIEAKRKEVKKACMAPYTEFEGRVKELVQLVDAPIAAIDGQLKEYEEKRRADKRAEIRFAIDYFTMRAEKYAVIGELAQSKRAFVLTGYILAKKADRLKKGDLE